MYEKNKEEFRALQRGSVAQTDAKTTTAQKRLSALTSSKTVSSISSSKTTTEKTTTTKKTDWAALQKSSLEYGKNSESDALRRAEIAANKYTASHGIVPYNMDDDIYLKVTHRMSNLTNVKQDPKDSFVLSKLLLLSYLLNTKTTFNCTPPEIDTC